MCARHCCPPNDSSRLVCKVNPSFSVTARLTALSARITETALAAPMGPNSSSSSSLRACVPTPAPCADPMSQVPVTAVPLSENILACADTIPTTSPPRTTAIGIHQVSGEGVRAFSSVRYPTMCRYRRCGSSVDHPLENGDQPPRCSVCAAATPVCSMRSPEQNRIETSPADRLSSWSGWTGVVDMGIGYTVSPSETPTRDGVRQPC